MSGFIFVSRPVFRQRTSQKNYGTNFLLLLSSNSYNRLLWQILFLGSEEPKKRCDRLESNHRSMGAQYDSISRFRSAGGNDGTRIRDFVHFTSTRSGRERDIQ